MIRLNKRDVDYSLSTSAHQQTRRRSPSSRFALSAALINRMKSRGPKRDGRKGCGIKKKEVERADEEG